MLGLYFQWRDDLIHFKSTYNTSFAQSQYPIDYKFVFQEFSPVNVFD